jgi:hypothetical protein
VQLLDFLKAVLPEDDSFYFVAVPSPSGKGFSHTSCSSIEELAHRIAHLEANTAQNIYFATSGFRAEFVDRPVQDRTTGETKVKRQHRIKENVKLVKAFWLDLDVGAAEAGKAAKYPDQRTAIVALNDFLVKTGLPRPMIISSGYGVHVYWPLTTSVLPGQWRATALQLKELTVGLGLLADSTRTADESSVLRPVGTTNRKIKNDVAGAMPVRCLLPLEGQPIPVVEYGVFHTTILAAMKANKVEELDTDKSKGLKVNPEDMIVPVGGFQKVSAIKVAERCNQIKLFRETGGISEPHWYRAIQIMPHTIEGEKLAHEWSAKHKEYTEPATEAKLAQIRGMGPTLCSTFNTANPDGCKNCPFAGKISTPLQLGMIVEEAPAPKVKEIVDGEEREVELPNPPWPFKRGSDEQPGLYIEIDQGVPVRFYPYDLYPTVIINDAGKLEGSVGVRHWLPREGWRDFNLALASIEAPREFLGAMRNNFVNPENGKYMVAYMDAYLRELQDKMKIKQLHTKMGWLPDHSFLLGSKMFTNKGTHPAGLSSTVSTKIVNSYHTRGTHEAWSDAIKLFDREGLEAHLFSILIGFGAPLLKLTGHGGAVAAMLGDSNAGKTLSARAMASIYGNFDPFKAGKTDTFNARIERLGMLSNLPVYLDETTNIKAEDVSELMYQISQGVGRTRLRSDSTVREAAEWSTIVLTSGNRSMAGRLLEAKVDPEAELVRLFEYTVAKHKWFEADMPGIYDVLDQNYGHAGEKYIKYLVQLEEPDTKARLREMTENFSKSVIFEGKERFWYALVACVLYGLWLADGSGALKFANANATYQRMWKWCTEQIMRQRTAVADNKFSSVEALSMFLNAHLADRLVVSEMGKGMVAVIKPPAAHGKLLIEYNQTTGIINIDQNAIRNWCSKAQLNTHEIRTELTKAGILIDHGARDFKVTMGRGTQFKGGQTRVWQVNAKHAALDGIDKLLERDPEVAG